MSTRGVLGSPGGRGSARAGGGNAQLANSRRSSVLVMVSSDVWSITFAAYGTVFYSILVTRAHRCSSRKPQPALSAHPSRRASVFLMAAVDSPLDSATMSSLLNWLLCSSLAPLLGLAGGRVQ